MHWGTPRPRRDECSDVPHAVGRHDPPVHLLLHARDEDGMVLGQTREQREINVGAIEHHDGARRDDFWINQHLFCITRLLHGAVGHAAEHREVSVMIVEHVELDGALRRAGLRPREEREIELEEGRIYAEKGVFEAAPSLTAAVVLGASHHGIEEVTVDLPRPLRVGVRQCRMVGDLAH